MAPGLLVQGARVWFGLTGPLRSGDGWWWKSGAIVRDHLLNTFLSWKRGFKVAPAWRTSLCPECDYEACFFHQSPVRRRRDPEILGLAEHRVAAWCYSPCERDWAVDLHVSTRMRLPGTRAGRAPAAGESGRRRRRRWRRRRAPLGAGSPTRGRRSPGCLTSRQSPPRAAPSR